ncbi:integrase [Streptomyces sp. ID05-39B]|uniref:integrase n=1 Tax=Streptomyces sp. ID05-39B TaxID=3028664 RepID=UPI0029A9BB40|nr:integrase [Streptomyces sp. ID05-39B]MDX3527518.1 integrase [Streptomyces sp. ID05-39B]
MTTALTLEADPYILPLPGLESPVVLDRWISAGNTHPNSRYSEDVWSMGPLTDNPGDSIHKINMKRCPASLRSEFRRLIWVLINGELRPTYVQERGFQNRGRDGVINMRDNILQWMKFARWLDRQGVPQLSDCTVEHWKAYAAVRTSGCTRDHALTVLRWLSDLWAFDQLSVSPCGITQPPWESEGIDDYLPAAKGEAGGENKTEPLDPTVIGPLLTWSIRLVEDFSDDILAAWAERRRMHARVTATPSTRGGLAAVKNYLQPLVDSGALLPATVSRKHGITLAHHYVAAVTGASWNQVHDFATRRGLRALAARRPGPSPMQVPVTGRIEGRPWREFMDYEETPILVRHLATAATIVILYLTGMRPQEARSLRSGCCPDPQPNPDGSMPRHLIRAHHYKNVRDSDGHHISAGEERAVPWVAITPVVNAIRVLERIVPKGELLFSSAHHDVVSQRNHHGALKRGTLDRRVENLVSWINQEATAQGLDAQMVPEDPHGNLGLSRLRRTLAWHIARRPGGLVALAIQYGHMRTALDARTSTGYGNRGRRGFHGELDVETALAAAQTAARLRDAAAAGEKISGPAARRALIGATSVPSIEGALTTPKVAAKFLARDGLALFDNPDSFLICAFKRDTALCDPDPGATAPNQFACQLGCGNAIRTDSHAQAAREHAERLDAKAALVPQPLGDRFRRTADRFRALADAHDSAAQSTEEAIA